MAKSNPIKNVPLRDCRRFLEKAGCKPLKSRGKGGHEIWGRKDLLRSITLQSHVDPVPEFIMSQILKNLNIPKEEFVKILKGK
jgi:hypothetical protein